MNENGRERQIAEAQRAVKESLEQNSMIREEIGKLTCQRCARVEQDIKDVKFFRDSVRKTRFKMVVISYVLGIAIGFSLGIGIGG